MAHVTIPEQNEEKTFSSYTGTGPLSFTWDWFEESDIRVFLDGSTTPLAAEDYSVTPTTTVVGGYSGGYVTLSESVTSADILLQRSKRGGRETDFATGGAKPQDVNTALDKLTAQYVDLRRDLNRAVVMPPGDNSNILYIGTAAQRAFKVPAFNADGTEIELVDRADIDAIASIANEIANLGTADAINDINTLTSGDNLSNIEALVPAVDNMALLGTVAAVADMAALADTGIIADMDALADLESELSALGASNVVEDITLLAGASVLSAMSTLSAISEEIEDTAAVAGQIATVAADIGLGANSNILNAEQNADNALLYAQQALRDALLCGPYALSDNRYWSSGDDGAPEDMDVTPVTFITNSSDSTWAPLGANGDATQISPRGAWRVIDNRVYRITLDIETSADGTGTPGFRVAWVMMDEDFAEITTINEDVESLAASSGRAVYEWRASTAGISPVENTELTTAGAIWVRPRLLTNPSGTDGDFNVHGFIIEDITPLKDAEQVTSAEGMALGATAGAVFTEDDTVGEALVRLAPLDEDDFASDADDRAATMQATGAYIASQLATVPNRAASLALMTAIGVAALSAGYTLQIEEADRGGTFVLTDASYSDDGGVIFAPDTPVGNLHWRRVYDGPVQSKWFGLTLDKATDNTADVQAIVTKYHAALEFNDGDYYFTASSILATTPKGINIPSNSWIKWSANAWFYHEAGTDTNQLLGSQAGENITLIAPKIDGQNAKTNLIGFGSPSNVKVWFPHCKNVRKARTMARPSEDPAVAGGVGGGQGITMQGYPKKSGVIGGLFESCAVGIDAGLGNDGENMARSNSISACHFEYCEQIFGSAGSVVADGSGDFIYDEDETVNEYKVTGWAITGNTFYNCGRSIGDINVEFTRRNSTSSTEYPFACPARAGTSYNPSTAGFNWEVTDQSDTDLAGTDWVDGTSYDATDVVVMNDDGKFSALITGLNTGGILIDGLSGYNDESYGDIGAIVWGTFASCMIRNVNVNVNTEYMVRFGGTPATLFNTLRHYQVSKFVDFDITNHGNTKYAYRIDNPIGVTNEYKLEGMRLKLAFRETGHTSLVHSNNTAAYATNNKADESYVKFINLETQEELDGRIDILGNGSYELSSHSDGVRTISARPLQIVNHSADAMLRLTRTGTNTADIEIYALADRLQIDGGGLSVETLGVGTTPPTTKAMQISYDSGHTATTHEVFKFARAGGNFRGVAFGYLGDGAEDTDGYMAANANQSLVIGHNNNVNTSSPNIYVDGANNRVGFLTKTPAYEVDVAGDMGVSGALHFSGAGSGISVGSPTELTIATGAVTVTGPGYYRLTIEGGAPGTDDLDTINGGSNGDIIIIRTSSSTGDVTVKNGTGNIYCDADLLLNVTKDKLMFIHDNGEWHRIGGISNQ